MDAISSSSGNGFDAALKALEDLETSVNQTRDEAPAAAVAPAAIAPAIEPISAIDFSDAGAPAAITAIPVLETVEQPANSIVPPALPIAPLEAAPAIAATAELEADPAAAPIAAPATAAAEPVVVTGAPKPSRLTKVAIGLGLVSSAISAAGLVVAERTIMSAQLVVADARERQQQLAQATKLISDLQLVRDKQVELLAAQQAQLQATPVTSDELQHRMETLQTALVSRDPMTNMINTIREGQSDTNDRLNEIGMKIGRVEAAVGGH